MMNNIYTVPLPDDLNCENIIIDMSVFNSEILSEDKYKSILLYLRNCGVSVTMNFDNCAYCDISNYLIYFITGYIEIESHILSSTWIEVLYSKYEGSITLPSLLNEDDIKRFRMENNEIVSRVEEFINSLPVLSLYFSNYPGDKESIKDLEIDECDINLSNFHKLLKFDEFIQLIESVQNPKFYEKIFNTKNISILSYMNSLLPYSAILSMCRADDESMKMFMDGVRDIISINETDKGCEE